MESIIKKYIIFIVVVCEVYSMSIKGPALTRYDPCGLAVLHFDKISDNNWQGVINLGLYPNLVNVQIEITFDNPVEVYGSSENISIFRKDDWRTFVMKLNDPIPKKFNFYCTMNNFVDSDSEVPTVNIFSLNDIILCNDVIKASQTITSLNVTANENENYKHVCGRRSLDHTELVSVRTESAAGDWPWHVAILIKDPNTDEEKYECGGNIISRTAIVTAGHCVAKNGVKIEPNRVVVLAGISNHRDVNQIGRQKFIAEDVILHPTYKEKLANADLAVIKVNTMKFTEYVQPICIWGPSYDKTKLFGQQATVVGFGSTEDNKPSDVLRSAYTVVQNDTTCINFSPEVYEDLMDEFTFCAGYGFSSNINPRNGDSGGGLVMPSMQVDHKISWFLRGVLSKCGVSPGRTECDPTYYVVYTDVGPHYGWLYHHSGLRYKSNIVE